MQTAAARVTKYSKYFLPITLSHPIRLRGRYKLCLNLQQITLLKQITGGNSAIHSPVSVKAEE